MFILSKNRAENEMALAEFCRAFSLTSNDTVHSFPLGDYWLSWVRSKPWESLYSFDNGYLIGRIELSYDDFGQIVNCNGPLPDEIHPLSIGVKFEVNATSVTIHPFNITNVFYTGDVVSDMQLLIGRLGRLLPSPASVAVLSSVGYFPGNLTLFEEVTKIPILFSYRVDTKQLVRSGSFSVEKADDEAMIDRLLSIVPAHPLQYIGMSGGYDSRFVLGILKNGPVSPVLCHLQGNESEIVSLLAERHKIGLQLVPEDTPSLSPADYTLATDAQIYFRGGNYSRARNYINHNSLYHSGLFADSLLKNAFKTAVKLPGSVKQIYPKLIDHSLLSLVRGVLTGLRAFADTRRVRDYLLDELSFGNKYYPFRRKKEWANWFYYLHRGVRWTQATTADLSYFTHPVFLLSDLPALSFGITSSLWDNFKKDRVRRMCFKLLSESDVPFDDHKKIYTNAFANAFMKLQYEYLERYIARRQGQRIYHSTSFSYNRVPSFDPPESFQHYFVGSIDSIINDSSYHRSLRRAAVTLFYALQFLESGRMSCKEA